MLLSPRLGLFDDQNEKGIETIQVKKIQWTKQMGIEEIYGMGSPTGLAMMERKRKCIPAKL